jgi:DNA-binding NarL/FixJ family response regulator
MADAFDEQVSRKRPSVVGVEVGGERGARQPEITLILVDSRTWRREALAHALETACHDFRVLRFSETSELADAQRQGGVALVLLNMNDGGIAADRVAAAIAIARSRLPGVPVVAISEGAGAEEVERWIERGLSGYLPMSLELKATIDALRFVAAGGTFVPAELFTAALAATPAPDRPAEPIVVASATITPTLATPAVTDASALTPRELAVLERLRQGESNKHIARQLGMREATVKVHVRHIMRKLGAANRTQVALLAERLIEN